MRIQVIVATAMCAAADKPTTNENDAISSHGAPGADERPATLQKNKFWSLTHGFKFGRKLGDWEKLDTEAEAEAVLQTLPAASLDDADDERLQEAIRQSLCFSQGAESASGGAVGSDGAGPSGRAGDSSPLVVRHVDNCSEGVGGYVDLSGAGPSGRSGRDSPPVVQHIDNRSGGDGGDVGMSDADPSGRCGRHSPPAGGRNDVWFSGGDVDAGVSQEASICQIP